VSEYKVKSQLNEIEKRLFSSQLKVNGISIWPLVKDCFFFKLLSYENDKSKITSASDIYSVPKLYSLKKLYYQFRYLFYLNKIKNEIKSTTDEVLFLFFDVTNAEYLDNLNGKSYSRFITPYYDKIKEKYKTFMVKLPIQYEPRLNKLNLSHESEFLLIAKKFYFLANIGKMIESKTELAKLTQSMDEVINSDFKFEHYSGELSLKLLEINFYKEMSKIYFKHVKPQVVFLETFYGHPDYYGVILQAREYGIKVVDIQHGNASSFMYSGYEFEKNEIGCLLPNYYWTWSKLEFNQMNNQRKDSELLKPIHLGKCEFVDDVIEDADLVDFFEFQKSKYDKLVLISFQYYYREYEFLSQIINESKNTLFLIRFHPLDYKDVGFREYYINLFSSYTNIEYKIATYSSLDSLLKYSDLHMTLFSTVGIEALKYGLRTVLLNKKYADSHFSEYVSRGVFLTFENNFQLLNIIKDTNKLSLNEKEYFSHSVLDKDFKDRLQTILN
jgi:hypothetical protein